ncbi:MAG: lipopolysaccharide transport periplasmic protein LptA [Pseudomonadota bacterium]
MIMAGLAVALLALAPVGLTATGALAQDSPFGSFKHDASQPIEITADSLTVNQTQQIATFKGNVIVGQGTLRLTADEMQIFYDADASAEDSETGRIRLLKALGAVFLSNGTEAAEGEWAEYDVAKGVIKMGGEVLLTQGENALAGDSLWIDLNAGLGEITGRVKTVFQPASQDETN